MHVLYRAEAATDMAEGFSWYEGQRPGLGTEFTSAVQTTISMIEQFPQAFPSVHKDLHRALVR